MGDASLTAAIHVPTDKTTPNIKPDRAHINASKPQMMTLMMMMMTYIDV